uniref:TPR domain-containing protein n=1 Tax=Colletotrichum fructicola (strain Nara gc5) TaxID=1213859 RepID=L2FK72_COLFN
MHAIEVVNEGIEAAPQNHLVEALLLCNLGRCYGRLFQRSGILEDINKAIEAASKSVAKTPEYHFNNIIVLDNLAAQLSFRHERTGSMADIDRAVLSLRAALNLAPKDHFSRTILLSNLSFCLGMRYKRTKLADGIDGAIDALDEAIEDVPEGHPNHARFLLNLGSRLDTRCHETGSVEDLDRGITSMTKAIDLTPDDHPDHSLHFNNLGRILLRRFQISTSMADLDLAFKMLNIAVRTIPEDHNDRINVFSNLSHYYYIRFLRTRSADDFESHLSSCIQGWKCENSSPSLRILLALDAAELFGTQSRWEEANEILRSAINIVPALSPRALKSTDQQHMLADVSGIASLAAAAALNTGSPPEECLRLLELGRGVMASLLLETRTEVAELEQNHPDLAERFQSLRDELDTPLSSEMIQISNDNVYLWEMQALRRRELDKSFTEVIEEIRTKTGFENFLLAPEVQDLLNAASLGPIVVLNANRWRCDAFLITPNDIQLLPLPLLADTNIDGAMEISSSLLEKLWDNAVFPILERLGFSKRPEGGKLPRLFWILTGSLSRLPFHAAGYHYEGSSDTVLDRVVSSYVQHFY